MKSYSLRKFRPYKKLVVPHTGTASNYFFAFLTYLSFIGTLICLIIGVYQLDYDQELASLLLYLSGAFFIVMIISPLVSNYIYKRNRNEFLFGVDDLSVEVFEDDQIIQKETFPYSEYFEIEHYFETVREPDYTSFLGHVRMIHKENEEKIIEFQIIGVTIFTYQERLKKLAKDLSKLTGLPIESVSSDPHRKKGLPLVTIIVLILLGLALSQIRKLLI